MKIVSLWVKDSNKKDEEFFYKVGEEGVVKIEEHQAQGDKWFYDVHFNNGSIVREFNFTRMIKIRE